VSLAKFFPLVSQLGQYLKMGMDHYAYLRAAGQSADPDIVAFFLREKLASWNPKLGSKELLDDSTRDAAARFLAGVAVNAAGT
jgi:hypothetical protein